MTKRPTTHWQTRRRLGPPRRGIIVVLTGFLMTVLFAFMALSVDTGRVVLTGTQMQNAVDAASLAAATEISAAVQAAGIVQGAPDVSSGSAAVQAVIAETVAEANGVYIDKDADVFFGKRTYDEDSGSWAVEWNSEPFNAVKVVARRTNDDTTAPDGELKLVFGWAVGKDSVPVVASSTAFVEARDLVLVCDFSASMNDDSSINAFNSLGQSEVEDQLDAMWDALVDANPKWPGTTKSKFPSSGYGDVDSYEGTYMSSYYSASSVFSSLDLNDNYSGSRKYPFPQSGRYSDGTPKPKLSDYWNDQMWYDYIYHVRGVSGYYRNRYGFRTLMDYFQERRFDWYNSEDLWRTPHYPFHAVKNGATLFLDFLNELDFGDEVGLVGYGQWAVTQTEFSDGEVDIDISADPITVDYPTIDTIQRRHQAGEYAGWTAMGDGILHGRELLVGEDSNPDDEGYARPGARPTMFVMTDGQTNQKPSGWSLPSNFHWSDWTDFNGDGSADYSTSDTNKQYAFWEATESIKKGITIHTMAVGEGADRPLMEAIAAAGGGVFISVPGGTSISEMEDQVLDAFAAIASKVPPPKLVYDLTTP
jgi:Flp pilus assembly protein TadG